MPATQHLLDAERLALMKPTAVLVNTSRGGIIDSRALLDALNQNRLAAAALDVLENEDVITEDRVLTRDLSLEKLQLAVESYQLIHHPRVLVTPHMAFYSQEALQRIVTTTVENIAGFAAGSPANVVASPA
jgi:D-lactate dehydrogenase